MVSVTDEFDGCDFGDKRLNSRLSKLSKSMSENPELSINAACGSFDQSKAAYRFFQNEKVSIRKIQSSHIKNTCQRAQASNSEILVIQDTADLIYSQFPSTQGLGHRIKNPGFESSVKGLLLHSSLAVSREGIPLGLLHQTFFTYDEILEKRGQIEKNKVGAIKHFPIEKKGSYRWIEHFQMTNNLLTDIKTKVIHVADREADVFELLQDLNETSSNFVIRSCVNRKTTEKEDLQKFIKIDKKLMQTASIGEIDVCKSKKIHKCEVKVVQNLILKSPHRSTKAKSYDLKDLSLTVVEVKQKESGSDILHWRLLTNLPCSTFSESLNVVEIYKQRWAIESFHRILKSGFGIEKIRLCERKRLEKCAAVLSIVSWFIFWLFMFGRYSPKIKAELIFDNVAIKVLRISAKTLKVKISRTLIFGEAILIIAKLGGFLGRRSDGPPGMMSIWRGWKALFERIEIIEGLSQA